MSRRGPIWHSVRWAPFFVGSALALAGCYDMHGRGTDAGSDPTRPDTRIDYADAAPFPLPDAPAPAFDGGDRCAELIAMLRAGTPATEIGCDGRTFPRDCAIPVGECCYLSLECAVDPGDGGHVESYLSCDDSCAQGCAVQTMEDCALFPYCEVFDPHACGPGPETSIEGPACINRREGPCTSDADCAIGQHCQSYWINPCAGSGCAACGGEAFACTH